MFFDRCHCISYKEIWWPDENVLISVEDWSHEWTSGRKCVRRTWLTQALRKFRVIWFEIQICSQNLCLDCSHSSQEVTRIRQKMNNNVNSLEWLASVSLGWALSVYTMFGFCLAISSLTQHMLSFV